VFIPSCVAPTFNDEYRMSSNARGRPFVRLSPYAAPEYLQPLTEVAARYHLTHVFNPSLIVRGETIHIAFRAESTPGERPFRGYVVTSYKSGECLLLDLTELAEKADVGIAADPKLFEMDGELFATFNSGRVAGSYNDVCVVQLTPEIHPVQRVQFAHRRSVEKNWAFFRGTDGELRVLYSFDPLVVLRLISGTLGTEEDLTFEFEVFADVPESGPSLHVGTPLLFVNPTHSYLVVHRKWTALHWSFYQARLAMFSIGDCYSTDVSRRRLIHSFRTLFPDRKRANRRLFSATYFAGISHLNGSLVLSYGVNDVAPAVARITEELARGRAWQPI
jgi:hypothetical protein